MSEKFGRKQDFLAVAIVERGKINNYRVSLAKYLEQSSPAENVCQQGFFQPPAVSPIHKPINPLHLKPCKTSSQSKHIRNSELQSHLQEIDAKCSDLLSILGDLLNLKTYPTMNTALLSETYPKKAEKIKELICLSVIIQTKINEKYF